MPSATKLLLLIQGTLSNAKLNSDILGGGEVVKLGKLGVLSSTRIIFSKSVTALGEGHT